MSPPDGSTTLTLNDGQADEDRMRTALGLTPGHAHPNRLADHHRTGRETQVPATVGSARRAVEASDSVRARLATLTDELKAERSERVAAQQALADAQRAIQQLQTKLAHAEMAAAEALEAEHAARLAAEARLEEIAPAPAPKPAAELAAPKKRGRPPGKRPVAEAPEQEPVQWWLPSYRAQAKRGRPTDRPGSTLTGHLPPRQNRP